MNSSLGQFGISVRLGQDGDHNNVGLRVLKAGVCVCNNHHITGLWALDTILQNKQTNKQRKVIFKLALSNTNSYGAAQTEEKLALTVTIIKI